MIQNNLFYSHFTEPAVAKPAAAPQKKKKVEEEDPDMAELAAWAS